METPLKTASESLHPAADSSRPVAEPHQYWYGWLLLLVAGPLLLLLLKVFPALDQALLHSPLGHVVVVGGASGLGMLLALLVLRVGRQAEDGRIYLIGMGFLGIASIFFIHAISTPNVLMTGRNLATAWSAPLSLVLGAIFFALSGLDISVATNRFLMRRARLGALLFLAFWLAYTALFLILIPAATAMQPPQQIATIAADIQFDDYGAESAHHIHASAATSRDAYIEGIDERYEYEHQVAQEPPPVALADIVRRGFVIAGLLCYIFAAVRHYLLYRRSPSTAGLAFVCGMVLFGQALLTQQLSQVYSMSFWLYHAEEFIGFGVMSYAGLVAYRHGQSQTSLLDSMFLVSTRVRIQLAYTQVLDSLIEMLSHGEEPSRLQPQNLRRRFGMTETQVHVLEQAALAVAHERRQRQELEQLNTMLYQLEQNKEQLMQMVVHDLKNPLTALIGFLEILRMDQLSKEQMMLLDGALRSGKNLSGLIGDLLDVGRIEEGRLDLDRSLLAPRDLLTDCVAEMSAWLAQDGKVIRIEASADLPLLNADLRLIRRVLLNLLSNAIKHTSAGTYITLRAYPTVMLGDQSVSAKLAGIAIEVADTGPGIAPEYLELIFEKFGRVNGQQHIRQDSTGLGLTFCRLAVEAHGGTIDVSSVIGQGTTFRIILPIC